MASTQAQADKQKGNASFKAGNYADAIGHYTAAILADASDHTFALNRAAAYLKLGKYEDAERDCTTVLGLCPGSAKALFRRGQARVQSGRLELGICDLTQALEREPENAAVREELKKASGLLEKERRKKPAPPHQRRRRLPIKIVDSSQNAPSSSEPRTLTPISTRSIKHEHEHEPKPSPTTTTPPSPTDPNHARDKPRPVVSGGIFRASGETTIFHPPPPPREQDAHALVPVPPDRQPTTWFEFARAWDAAPASGLAVRWGLILSIRPSSVPALFKMSLEPALLGSVLGVLRQVLDNAEGGGEKERVRAYMDAFGRVERFETVVMFLSQAERASARGVWERLGVRRDDVGKAWESVWR